MRVLELYSGIGGMHLALAESGADAEVVAAVDVNTVANLTYRHNFPSTPCLNRNVESLSASEARRLDPEVILMSPPCQPFTRNGLRRDRDDRRTDSLFRLAGLLEEMPSLRYVLLENVKGFETSNARDGFVGALERLGFRVRETLLSPVHLGVPNSRLRYYCLARRDDRCGAAAAANEIPFPSETPPRPFPVSAVLDEDADPVHLSLDPRRLRRLAVTDVCHRDDRRSCCFTKAYARYSEGTGSVFCPLPKEEADGIVERSRLAPDDASREAILRELRLRLFSPREVARLMSFPETFGFPDSVTDRQRYALLGNSVNVRVVSELIKILLHSSTMAENLGVEA